VAFFAGLGLIPYAIGWAIQYILVGKSSAPARHGM
jgi:hypothetical protein